MKPKQILIVGIQRSGTSWLSALLGAHSKVNMLYEDIGDNIFKLYGKPVQGNKLVLWTQIRPYKKKTLFKSLFYRLTNWRVFPTCRMSLFDYIKRGAKIIIITRGSDAVIRSMMKRANYTYRQAENEYARGLSIINWLYTVADIYEMNYDALRQNKVNALSDLCEWIGIDFEIEMLNGEDFNFAYLKQQNARI